MDQLIVQGQNSVQVLENFSKINRQLIATIELAAGVTKYNFSKSSNYQTLQNTKLQQVMVAFDDNLTITPDGKEIVPAAVYKGSFLALKLASSMGGNIMLVDNVPLLIWVRDNTKGPIQGFANQQVDWTNSYVFVPDTLVSGNEGKVMQLIINYLDCN